jgi:hypothetical protein
MVLQNVGIQQPDCTVSQPRRPQSERFETYTECNILLRIEISCSHDDMVQSGRSLPTFQKNILPLKVACLRVLVLILSLFLAPSGSLKAPTPAYNHTTSSMLSSSALFLGGRYTVTPLFIVFVGGLKKKQCIRENNRCGSHS